MKIIGFCKGKIGTFLIHSYNGTKKTSKGLKVSLGFFRVLKGLIGTLRYPVNK